MISNKSNFSISVAEEVIEHLLSLVKDMEKNRKIIKEEGNKHKKALADSLVTLAKAKAKYRQLAHDWEKSILEKNKAEHNPKQRKSSTISKLTKSVADCKEKALSAERSYLEQLSVTNSVQNDFYSIHLPKVIKTGIESAKASDERLKSLFLEFAILLSNAALKDTNILRSTEYEQGVSDAIKSVDVTGDFKSFISDYSQKSELINTSLIEFENYEMSNEASFIINPTPIFGTALEQQACGEIREGIPDFVSRCCILIEKSLNVEGLYRVPGLVSVIEDLRRQVERDPKGVDMESFDVHVVATNLKQFFEKLPEPLMTLKLQSQWLAVCSGKTDLNESSGIEDVCNALKANVQKMPARSKKTLKFFIGHLNKVSSHALYNKMNARLLSAIFGPVLMCSTGHKSAEDVVNLSKVVVQWLIVHYNVVFENISPPQHYSPVSKSQSENLNLTLPKSLDMNSRSLSESSPEELGTTCAEDIGANVERSDPSLSPKTLDVEPSAPPPEQETEP